MSLNFSSTEKEILTSQIRNNLNTPYKNIRIYVNNKWEYIYEPELQNIDVSGGEGELGRATITIIKKNVNRDWITNLKKYAKIEIFEGWGMAIRRTFTGLIARYEVESSGDREGLIVTLTCLPPAALFKETKTLESKYDENTELDKIIEDIKADANRQLTENGLDSILGNIDPYTLQNYDPSSFTQKWEQILRLPNFTFDLRFSSNPPFGPDSFTTGLNHVAIMRRRNWMVLNATIGTKRKLLIIDLNKNISFNPKFVDNDFGHGGICIAADEFEDKVMVFGNVTRSAFEARSVSSPRLGNIIVYDFKKELVKTYSVDGRYIPKELQLEPTILEYTMGTDGNIYILTYDRDVLKLELDHKKEKAFMYYLGKINYVLTSQWLQTWTTGLQTPGNSGQKRAYANIFSLTPDTLTVIYLKDQEMGGYMIKEYDISNNSLEEIQEIEIGGYTTEEYHRTYYAGYYITTSQVINKGQYVVSNALTGQAHKVDLNKHFDHVAIMNNYMLGFEFIKQPKNEVILNRHKLITKEDEIGKVEYGDDFNIFEDTPQTYDIQPNISSLAAIHNVSKDAGMSLYTDLANGTLEVKYFNLSNGSQYADWYFEENEIINGTFKTAEDEYDAVEITYGKGGNTGTIRVGEGLKVLREYCPYLNASQAYTLANRILNTSFGGLYEFTARAVPTLGTGHIIDIIDSKMNGEFVGVCVRFSTSNATEGGYYGQYQLMGSWL